MATTSTGSVRVAWRQLRKRPGLALGRVLTIGIVITALAAVMSAANAIFLRPLPFPNPGRLVRLYLQPPGTTTLAGATPHYPFTFSRFLVPWLCDYQGWALFLDIDFLALGDVAELFALTDDRYAAMVSKNPKKFEWASMIMFNCGHPANRILTPDYVDDPKRCVSPHTMDWLAPELVGEKGRKEVEERIRRALTAR